MNELGLSYRQLNFLKKNGINTIEELKNYTEEDIRNMVKANPSYFNFSVEKLAEKLGEHGIEFKKD